MRFTKFVKDHGAEMFFFGLIIFFAFVYFSIYKTMSREAWYTEMRKQIDISINVIKELF